MSDGFNYYVSSISKLLNWTINITYEVMIESIGFINIQTAMLFASAAGEFEKY
jgi:hypothetical protein